MKISVFFSTFDSSNVSLVACAHCCRVLSSWIYFKTLSIYTMFTWNKYYFALTNSHMYWLPFNSAFNTSIVNSLEIHKYQLFDKFQTGLSGHYWTNLQLAEYRITLRRCLVIRIENVPLFVFIVSCVLSKRKENHFALVKWSFC